MKAQFLDRAVEQNSSIAVQLHTGKFFKKLWHYHPQLELMLIQESTGSVFVGDGIEEFAPGTLVLIGQNIPHLWQNDPEYFVSESNSQASGITIHFNNDFVGNLHDIPELNDIYELIQRAAQGIKFTGVDNRPIVAKINTMLNLYGYERLICFLDTLKMLSSHPKYKLLSSLGFMDSFKEIRDTKILPVYEYVMNNFKKPISLSRVASIANMNPSAFSRYFSSVQKKTFTQFVNEIRVGYACKLLIDGNHNIAQACFESGFNNLSNFNKHFRSIKNVAPSTYIKLYTNF